MSGGEVNARDASAAGTPAVIVHATTIAIGGRGVLVTGASGSGKSDLALRLIDRGAMLVADDYTELFVEDGALVAAAPATIAGRIEVRGIGIVALPRLLRAPVALAVRLDPAPERLPEPRTCTIAGVTLPEVSIDPFPASATLKVELALRGTAA